MLNYSYTELDSHELRAKIATRLHKERINAKLSLDALAEKINYSKPTVQSWEKGWEKGSGQNRIPNMDQLIDLAAIYNCTPEYLLCEYNFKTKEITDISLETGLFPENITRLQRMFSTLLENPYGGGANDLFLAFLNHFISNIDLINELLFNRQMLESVLLEFNEEPYKEDLLNGFHSVGIGGIGTQIFNDGVFSTSVLAMQYTQPLVEYYKSLNYDKDTIVTIMEKFTYYFDVISLNKMKQSDFAISDSFLDIVKSFFSEFPDNVYGIDGYKDFENCQREQISPERIKPIPIIKKQKNRS